LEPLDLKITSVPELDSTCNAFLELEPSLLRCLALPELDAIALKESIADSEELKALASSKLIDF